MSYTKQDLQNLHNLTLEEVDDRLGACGLPKDREDYPDQDIKSGFEVICSYFSNQLASNCSQAAELFKQQVTRGKQETFAPEPSEQVSGNGLIPTSVMNFPEMCAWVSDTIKTRVSWKEAGELLHACNLPDLDEYTESEAERFLEACDMYKNHHRSIDEIAASFELASEFSDRDIESNIESTIESTATVLEQNSNTVVRSAMRHKAKTDATAASAFYLQGLADEFGSPEFQQAWHQMEERLKDRVAGKSKMRAQKMLGEHQQRILPSRSPLNALPEALDDGSTTD